MTKFIENPVISVLLLMVLIIWCFLVLNIALGSTMDGIEWQEEIYRVQSGDSLWTVSHNYCPDSVDRREWIDQVQRLNGLTSGVIYAGQELTVLAPVEEV